LPKARQAGYDFFPPLGGRGTVQFSGFLFQAFLIWSLEIVTYLPKAQQEG
jgi:hypothetical protein